MSKIFRWKYSAIAVLVGTVFASGTVYAQSDNGLPIRGVVRALNTAAISTDLLLPIKKLNFRKGQEFKRGQVLAAFDCSRLEAERGALLAERKVQLLTVQNNLSLLKLNAIGKFDLEISKARFSKADAEVNRLDVRLARCVIKAPFDGKVASSVTLQYETPRAGVPFVEIVETSKLEVDFIVPSKWLAWLKTGTKFSVRIDETAKSYSGQVLRLGATVDPVSQTIEIRGRFTGETNDLLAGMSGSAKFDGPGS